MYLGILNLDATEVFEKLTFNAVDIIEKLLLLKRSNFNYNWVLYFRKFVDTTTKSASEFQLFKICRYENIVFRTFICSAITVKEKNISTCTIEKDNKLNSI